MQYWVKLTSGQEKVDGKELISSKFPDFDFFFYINTEGVFYICEFRSGFSVGDGISLGEAKLKAIGNFKKIGIERAKRILNTVLERYGRINIKRRNRNGKRNS